MQELSGSWAVFQRLEPLATRAVTRIYNLQRADAVDLVRDSAAGFVMRHDPARYPGDHQALAYLLWRCRAIHRSKHPKNRHFLPLEEMETTPDSLSPVAVHDCLYLIDNAMDMATALLLLAPAFRAAARLTLLSGCDFSDAAAELGLSRGSFSRALAALGRQLTGRSRCVSPRRTVPSPTGEGQLELGF